MISFGHLEKRFTLLRPLCASSLSKHLGFSAQKALCDPRKLDELKKLGDGPVFRFKEFPGSPGRTGLRHFVTSSFQALSFFFGLMEEEGLVLLGL